MKIGTPASRLKIDIKPHERVLDIGSGHFPHPRANVIVDKYLDDNNTHRSGDITVLKNQEFIQADGESLPFKDNEFDVVISSHTLEHVDNPDLFIKEMCRVGKRGYLETPSLIGEFLIPKKSHKWVLLDVDGTIVLYEKDKVGFNQAIDYGELFLNYFPRKSIGWKIMQRTHHQMLTLNYEWKDDIQFLVNPEDEKYLNYFIKPWDLEMINKVMPQRGMKGEAKMVVKAFLDITKSVFRSKVLKRER